MTEINVVLPRQRSVPQSFVSDLPVGVSFSRKNSQKENQLLGESGFYKIP